MKRLVLLAFFSIFWVYLAGEGPNPLEKSISIQIDNSRDYAILNEFLKQGFSKEEDYGYVIEGVKPISIRNFQALDGFLTPHYLDWELLVHEAIPIWNRICGRGKRFVFKSVRFSDSESVAPGFELQFINVLQLRNVIEENLSLFRYVLGPDKSTDELVHRIAYSDELLDDILKNDLTLVGIVLGFGAHNSMIGGKMDMVSSRVLSTDHAPFTPQHEFFRNTSKNELIFPEEMYRLYYLAFAGGDDYPFRYRADHDASGADLEGVEEALEKFKEQEDPLPVSLQKENPRFIFGAFKGGPSNQSLFEQLQRAQHSIQTLVKRSDFLETALEKIGGMKPTITCSKPSGSIKERSLFKNREKQWVKVLLNVAKRFEGERRAAFIDAFCKPTETSRQHPWALGATYATLQGLKKARTNLAAANKQFDILSQQKPAQFTEIVQGLLYVEMTKKGDGEGITAKNDHVRVGYIVEDSEGTILFANHDTWIHLSETIPGFAHGIQGMQIGEKRTLFVHPALGYGVLTTLPPCSSLTIKVYLLDIDRKTVSKKPFSNVKSLDLSWVNDSDLYEKIESSIHQIPLFTASFYRDWLDKKSGLNMELLTEELKKDFAARKVAE